MIFESSPGSSLSPGFITIGGTSHNLNSRLPQNQQRPCLSAMLTTSSTLTKKNSDIIQAKHAVAKGGYLACD
ncbi:hypothetical protein BVRB_5g107640 [Beta vulgaris subsp. vulgaris]|nr:hypothetical protein BVRB_5g107640 [Beta vulgaris subsp. vulgaris]